MDAFSYLSVLLSVILGLAIQQVLQGYRALALNRAHVTWYWPSMVWSVLLLGMVAQHWWASFDLTNHTNWSFVAFAAILVMTALIYMMAALVLPDVPADKPIDLRDHYFREAPVFFGFGVAAILWSMIRELLLDGKMIDGGNLAFHLGFLTLSIIAAITRRDWVHKLFAAVMIAMFVLYIAALFMKLG